MKYWMFYNQGKYGKLKHIKIMGGLPMDKEEVVSKNFIEKIIDQDLAEGKYTKIATRFPPEPNGYLHIGHAKSILLNYGLAKKYNGTFNLRFDDTNPMKEKTEFVESIVSDVEWLGAKYDGDIKFASNYFDQMYEAAVLLIKKGKAYVCDLSPEQIREYRGTLTEPGKDSPYRNRSIEENLDLFERMKNGEFEDGSKVLRAKIDMASSNINMRDPIIYRVARHTIIQEINGVFIQCMTLLIQLKMPLKELLIQFVLLNLKIIVLYMIGSFKKLVMNIHQNKLNSQNFI